MKPTSSRRNPKGRTGISGRGLLGRYGPNHAADPVVTRWKRDELGKQEKKHGLPVLEFVAVLREDTKEWAIPGVCICVVTCSIYICYCVIKSKLIADVYEK